MKPSNPKFWTRDRNGVNELRDLEREEGNYRHRIFPSWKEGIIDEPILIYYEVYDCHSSLYIDDCIYQAHGCQIQPGDHVLDLGGNIGIFSRFAADAGASKIYTFEPIQENFELLMLNRPDNCEAHRLAISNTDNQRVDLVYDPKMPGGSSFISNQSGEEQPAMTVTLNTLLDNGLIEKIDFMKMDIEGAEVMAFEGISDQHLSRIRCIAMEMHENVIGAERAKTIYDRLKGLDFKSFTITNPDMCNIVYFWK